MNVTDHQEALGCDDTICLIGMLQRPPTGREPFIY